MQPIQDKSLYQEYFDILRKRVTEKNLHLPSPWYGSMCLLFSSTFFLLGLLYIEKMPTIVVILYFSIAIIEISYLSHELIHDHYFRNKKITTIFSVLFANIFTGLSRSWWVKKHNTEHHIFTNSDIHDTDIRDYDEIFTKNPGKSQFFFKNRRWIFWLSTTLLYFNLIFRSYEHLIKGKKYSELCFSLISLGLLPYALVLHFGILSGLAILAIIYGIVGIHLAFVFMVNHIGMEIIDGNVIRNYSWLDLQTRTSRNISGGALTDHIFGGLSKQIEHHLFPQVSRYNIRKVAKEVRSFCQEREIFYHETSFFGGLREIMYALKTTPVDKSELFL